MKTPSRVQVHPREVVPAVADSIDGAAPRSLFDGVEAAVCKVLRITSLRHRSALHALGLEKAIPQASVAAALDQIEQNWRLSAAAGQGSTSNENWRWWTPQCQIGPANRSPEVVLERAIARACVSAGRTDWSNQVPVASGVVRSSGERRRAIDLVHQKDVEHFEFIELKIASDTPLYAAFEIISYVGVWLLSRGARSTSQLLNATRIDARVLAPAEYYAPFRLDALERVLNEELEVYGGRHGALLSFGFEKFHQGFVPLPHYADADIASLLAGRTRL